MAEYKNTLNLPHTDFPMKADLAKREPEFLVKWEKINLYCQLRKVAKGKTKYILHDGPPYANGHIHIGHAFGKTLKDIVVKSRTLSGFDAPYVPGWDCHGLPIELNVEKKFGRAGDKLSAKEFRQKCREYAREQMEIQREEFKRLGVLGDWDHSYLTMDYPFQANVIRALGIIVANGHLQQGFKPVHWCIDCRSALAEAEVEYANKSSPAIDVRFVVVDETGFFKRISLHHKNDEGKGPISIPIWTTTPWTLPANEAVAIHPEHDYVLIQIETEQGQERLVIAAGELLKTSLERYDAESRHEIARFKGNVLEGVLLQHPFYEKQVPVILGEHVTLDAGTGAVHTAPAHGQDDYVIGKKYNLPAVNPVGSNGAYLDNTPLFAGLHVFKANPVIIDLLKQKGALLSEKNLEHSYPHCWRHKTPLIFLATPQWFVSMDKKHLREDALAAIRKVAWIPEWGENRIYTMVEQRPDWCISRQRTWGVPIALFVHKQTREIHPQTQEIFAKVADLVEQGGVDAWYEVDAKELIGADAENYEKITDILDVWFDAGVTHYAVLKQNPELAWPANLYLEGSDQHRGWFQTSLLTSIAMYEKAPYEGVLTHGFTVDDKGRKMSKSLGNVIAPDKVISTLGADILRLWAASTDYRGEIAVSDEILKRTAEAYRRIRNTARFLLANLHDFDPSKDLIPDDKMLALDKFIVDRANTLQTEIIKAYDDFQFHAIYQKLHNFCINDLGGFYLDIIKDRQYTMQKNSIGRRSAQTALYHIADAMVRWMAPILSFTAEEIWGYMPGERAESVFLTTWYSHLTAVEKDNPLDVSYWDEMIHVRYIVNKELEKYRNEGKIGSPLEAEVTLYANEEYHALLSRLQSELRFVFITSEAKVLSADKRPQDAEATEINGLWIAVNPSTNPKCVRCWHRRVDCGVDPKHPELCGRCVENVEGEGEIRLYA